MSTQEIDKAKLGRLIEKAGQCYEMSRLMEQDAEGYLAEVQRLMDYAHQLPRISSRHWKAFFRQPDGRQGKRARAHGGP